MKVYVVHSESGQYSDWTYDVRGVFGSYERARAYVEAQTVEVCHQQYVEHRGEWSRDVDRWIKTSRLGHVVETRSIPPTSTDGVMFSYQMPNGVKFQPGYESFFITEYELDAPANG